MTKIHRDPLITFRNHIGSPFRLPICPSHFVVTTVRMLSGCWICMLKVMLLRR